MVRVVVALLGVASLVVGVWALTGPDSFASAVAFPPQVHFVHDVGAFQFGIGATLLLALIWADGPAVALAGYLVGAVAHTVSHVVDAELGGSPAQTWLVGLSAVLALVGLVARLRQLGWVVGHVDPAPAPAWAPLVRQKTVVLTTFKRDGTAVPTAVSVAVAGERAYVRSFEKAWKTRRIANNPRVTLAPSTGLGRPTGAAVEAVARRLTGAECRAAGRALARKHPVLHGVLVPLTHRLGRARTGRTVHFELIPAAATGRPVAGASTASGTAN
ncbi:PPOX class F420-dependent oxidoreductase [Micromonospora sp. PPF5-17]|uniref:PPOX class F420-dependent oxidoreductase n=2 Tax=Micromonosporaceae TaxID=28056 RepID=A0ABX9WHE9_9ACTN|nr:PPOX class F420-dependent oxidoreductase [Micromonospora sp. PPF5-17B]NES37215.1 PPOX class F420-dependent oxidoreductase [Micromonospora solifontis]NES57148.1 PPOX class F420-dependent oxidoreductase [Micromonospora sp. PPF5-6]RNL98566.1 PPOX class F420-dependent oxidoreductase [Micromonospora solifontis]